MPEIGECYTIARQLPQLGKIARIEASARFAQYIAKTPKIVERLRHKSLGQPTAYGKAVLFPVYEQTQLVGVLVSQMGMSGSWFVNEQGRDPKNDHLTIWGEQIRLRYSDPRMFGKMRYFPVTTSLVEFLPELRKFYRWGLDPHQTSAEDLIAAMQVRWGRTTKNLKTLLLEQNVVFGVGNYLASEILWAAKLDPKLSGNKLKLSQLTLLVKEMKRIVALAIKTGGYSFAGGYYHPDGSVGTMAKYIKVYERDRQPCPTCSTKIKKMVIGGRSTYLCPRCQRRNK